MSDTPRTDALDAELTEREIDRALDFARQLERELAEQNEQFRCVRWQLLLCRHMNVPYLTCAGERQKLLKEKNT